MNYLWSAIFGLAIILAFVAIRRLDVGQPWITYRPPGDLIHRRVPWTRYAVFRLAPPTTAFVLLAALLSEYWPDSPRLLCLLLCAVTSLLPRDFRQIIARSVELRQKLAHAVISFVVLALAVAVWAISLLINMSTLAPNISGLIDNAWAALVILVLAAGFWSLASSRRDEAPAQAVITNEIQKCCDKFAKKFDATLGHLSRHQGVSQLLLLSIAIYEDMNRPKWLRYIENLIVRIPGVELSVGICQVKSRQPLTDSESLQVAGKRYLVNTQSYDFELPSVVAVAATLTGYNDDPLFVDRVYEILEVVFEHRSQNCA